MVGVVRFVMSFEGCVMYLVWCVVIVSCVMTVVWRGWVLVVIVRLMITDCVMKRVECVMTVVVILTGK